MSRKRGTPNKLTVALKEAILQAANEAGGEEGLIGYLTTQAVLHPSSFLALLGRLLPLAAAGDQDNPINVRGETHVFYTRKSASQDQPKKIHLPYKCRRQFSAYHDRKQRCG